MEHILHEESALLYLSLGNYFDRPTVKEVGGIIVRELEKSGFTTKWNETAETKIAQWSKCFANSCCASAFYGEVPNSVALHNSL